MGKRLADCRAAQQRRSTLLLWIEEVVEECGN